MPDTEDLLLRLTALPPEIREHIWSLTVIRDEQNDQRIPAVLKAMRPAGTLYRQYLDQFYRNNIFKFDLTRIHTMLQLNEDHLRKIRRLDVEFRNGYAARQQPYHEFLGKIVAATDLEGLDVHISHIPSWIRIFIHIACREFLKLKSFSIHLHCDEFMFKSTKLAVFQFIKNLWLEEVQEAFRTMSSESRSQVKSSVYKLCTWEAGNLATEEIIADPGPATGEATA